MLIIDDRYYREYEGEGEIDFICQKNGRKVKKIQIWEGYFLSILNGLIKNGEKPVGMLCMLLISDTWDKEPWRIPDIQEMIIVFEKYDENNFSESERPSKLLLDLLPEVLESIIKFLKEVKENNGDVYMEYL
ncbi:Uncharacterised protein [Sebaldella termitidis]|uniref:Uncharacterized protein n=1 Tax=Sebaldella termitidis (strain ATCC 33386 / NCTC 11300) TaxID=526218 RepID=D1AMT0_SEBTE|nr:hypothetical protein [Sebaldella termitidis]ACZ07306.1 hypothetical protein Sterm_0424 [Sebaldella termitidis ATCC 33386]SUI22599.1 Uncharacterised protein [Sebaldella termitidis]